MVASGSGGRRQLAGLWEAAKQFLDAKRTADGFVSAEDAAAYDRMETDVVNLGKEIERLERQTAIDAELARATSKPITNQPNGRIDGETKTGRASAEYKRAFWNGMRPRICTGVFGTICAGALIKKRFVRF